jgi:hypothetical protein
MKKFILTAAVLIAATIFSRGQGQPPVVDTHPNATIYIYDPQSSQEVLAQSDAAILFKDALVNLVSNMTEAKMISHTTPGHKTIIITQASPDQGNAYQVEMDDKMMGQTSVLYTFSYNVDQNTLYYFDQNSQTWVARPIQPYNVSNLNDCQAYGKFNDPQTWNVQADDGTGDDVVQANTPPPALQEEVQPECPVDGYLWQPGYWAYNRYNGNYYWVAGTWVAPPNPGYLWTPPYWGFEGGVYGFHHGYWGLSIGFYGGINYGYGYVGHGYYGGVWESGHFKYNTAVVHVNTTIVHNTYVDRTVIVNNTTINNTTVNNRTSFNGPGGVTAKPTPTELAVANKPHIVDNSQDPKAAVAAKNHGNAGQAGAKTSIPSNNNKPPVNGVAPQKTQEKNLDAQKTAPNNFDDKKTPMNGTNNQRTPANNTTTSKAPANAPAVPTVPGKGQNSPRAGGNNQQGGQRQGIPGQTGGQKGGKQPANKQPPPPSKDKKTS